MTAIVDLLRHGRIDEWAGLDADPAEVTELWSRVPEPQVGQLSGVVVRFIDLPATESLAATRVWFADGSVRIDIEHPAGPSPQRAADLWGQPDVRRLVDGDEDLVDLVYLSRGMTLRTNVDADESASAIRVTVFEPRTLEHYDIVLGGADPVTELFPWSPEG